MKAASVAFYYSGSNEGRILEAAHKGHSSDCWAAGYRKDSVFHSLFSRLWKTLNTRNLMGARFILNHSSRVQSIPTGKAYQQEPEAVGHIASRL